MEEEKEGKEKSEGALVVLSFWIEKGSENVYFKVNR